MNSIHLLIKKNSARTTSLLHSLIKKSKSRLYIYITFFCVPRKRNWVGQHLAGLSQQGKNLAHLFSGKQQSILWLGSHCNPSEMQLMNSASRVTPQRF